VRITIAIKNLQKKIPVSQKKVKSVILKTLSEETVKIPVCVTVCFVNDAAIRKLNLKYLGQDAPTDVLAFSATGDVVISTDTAVRNSTIFKTTPVYETYLYVVHGILHLSGYEDKTCKGKKLMEDKAKRILRQANINYANT
jgi:probable rRNA maturation factor